MQLSLRALVCLPVMGCVAVAAASDLPPRVPSGLDPGGVPVALIDTGVNYTLPLIASRLARDGEGEIIGLDYERGDRRPFDRLAGDASANPVRHGTLMASIILREAVKTSLIPFRFPHNAPASYAGMVMHIAQTPARIAAVPLAAGPQADWMAFRAAALRAPHVLFIVPAGDAGQDIDRLPIYPAAFGLPNVLVVTACDQAGRLLDGANWGAKTVHVAIVAKGIQAVGFDGQPARVSGSDVAVARAAAQAARLLAQSPHLTAEQIKAALLKPALQPSGWNTQKTQFGWLAR